MKLLTALIIGSLLLATLIKVASNIPTVSTQTEIIKAVYETDGYLKPEKFQVKAGSKVRLEVLAKIDGEGCMGSIMVPDFSEEVYGFEQGKTVTFEFTATNPGEYWITCAMGVPHGMIVVN